MPRVDDRPFPSIGGHRPDVEPWPTLLYIGVARQPVAQYVYDDYTAHYDDPEADYTYDDREPFPFDRFDLFCQFHGLTIETGSPDDEGSFDAGHVEMTLDNRDGSLSQYDSAGRLVDYLPGAALDIWATVDGAGWWLFSGHVTAWRERADGTVDVEAFDAFDTLNQQVTEWDPGVYEQTPGQRLTAICTAHGYTGGTRFDAGDVTLHSFRSTATPLEEMQSVALSDGGVLAVDADGTVIYRDRYWIAGRPDQTTVPTFSDNYCPAPVTVWEADKTTDDDVIVNDVTLTNLADVTVTAINQLSIDRIGRRTLPAARRNDQWIDAADGQDLANYLVSRRGDAYLRLERFELYLHDARQDDLWPLGVDRRLGDIVTWLHEQATTTGADLVIVNLAVQHIVHEITPESWVTTIATTRTVGNTIASRYDQTAYTYDEPDPLNVYAF